VTPPTRSEEKERKGSEGVYFNTGQRGKERGLAMSFFQKNVIADLHQKGGKTAVALFRKRKKRGETSVLDGLRRLHVGPES